MKATLLACSLLLLTVFFSPVKAQTDTTKTDSANLVAMAHPTAALTDTDFYDLGRMTMQKRFTQAVTIKASTLEKLPFTNLSDAINVYFNGIYGDKKTFAFMVDGMLNTDVNAYSIFDIDEITIIQNAATVLNGITPQQVLVLVKTKKSLKVRSGLVVNGQTNMVSLYQTFAATTTSQTQNSGHSTTGYYQQYYLSGYINRKNISAGVSASIQHNLFPELWNKDIYDVFKPYNSNRFRFNGYFDVKLSDNYTLSINGGYVPERSVENLKGNAPFSNNERKTFASQNLWYSNITLKTQILPGFTNKLSGSFQRLQTDLQISTTDSANAVNSYLAKDELSYRLQIGDFTINPAVNLAFRQGYSSSLKFYNVSPTIKIREYAMAKEKLAMITPSLTLNYGDFVMVQGGVQKITNTNLPAVNSYNLPKLLPFGSISVDVLRPFDVPDTSIKLLVFGSFARNMGYASEFYGTLVSHFFVRQGNAYPVLINSMINPYQVYDQVQGGLTLSLLKNMLRFSYNFDSEQFSTRHYIVGTAPFPPYIDTTRMTNARVDIHRIGINFNLPLNGKFSWASYLNAAMFIKRAPNVANVQSEVLREFFPGKNLISGGFVNQFGYKRMYAGVDLLYSFYKALPDPKSLSTSAVGNPYPIYVQTEYATTFSIQNLYIGYKFPVKKFKYFEVYANSRNLFEKGQQNIVPGQLFVDDRRFMGAGFKLEL
jgi:hypothetical protein